MEKKLEIQKKYFIPFSKRNLIKDDYYFHEEIGEGAFARVFRCTHKSLLQERAVKVVIKQGIHDTEQIHQEYKILMEIDHPNIIKLYEVYESESCIFLVLEYCQGGELFDMINEKGKLMESEVAIIFKQIISAVNYCHSFRICHKDIKPENFVLKVEGDIQSLKLIDFGQSQKLCVGEYSKIPNGSLYFLAPEMLDRKIDFKADMWSIGVLMYVMICGSFPFQGVTKKDTVKAIYKGHFTFNDDAFKICSDEVKDLLLKLLVKDPKKRISAEKAYQHPWVQWQVDYESNSIKLEDGILQKIGIYGQSQKFKKIVLFMIAIQILDKETEYFEKLFKKLDQSGDGVLSKEEFIRVFDQNNTEFIDIGVPETELGSLVESLDLNYSGKIDYSEFLAVLSLIQILKEDRFLKESFNRIDVNQNGLISRDEIKTMFNRDMIVMPDTDIDELMEKSDTDKDGRIDFNEFITMMREINLDTMKSKFSKVKDRCHLIPS